jgi:hypothetical protein
LEQLYISEEDPILEVILSSKQKSIRQERNFINQLLDEAFKLTEGNKVS